MTLHSLPPTATRDEVESQPEIWSRVIAGAATTIAVLPEPGTPVLVVGCGTSYYIGKSYARLRNTAGAGRTRAAVASEIPFIDPAESVVVLSRSGTTTDVARVAEALRATTRVVGIVGVADTPVAAACHDVVLLNYADEKSVVQTRFATSALLLLRASLGEDVSGLPDQARAALELPLDFALPQHVVFLGAGWAAGLADEAALKCREAAAAWTEAYPVMEFQHGPIAAAGPNSLIWALSPVPDQLRRSIEETGATLFAPALDPLAQLVAAHRLALWLAEAAGRDPDRPRYLTRSVQLG